jgi:hypothetical protein
MRGRRVIWRVIIVLVVVFSITEITLRKAWGFGDMVLFREDANYEYIAVGNQSRNRFGNKVIYNSLSMRSLPLSDTDECVVLGFGDSVLNGGTLTDQDSLATSIVETDLSSTGRKGFRFLNISAGSWGPDNCAAYLKKHGDFNAKMIVLMVSSHDARDNMTFEKVVGQHEGYPKKQYPLAVVEVVSKYIIPKAMRYITKSSNEDNLMINKKGKEFNKGFEFFRHTSMQSNIPLLVCLHAERDEIDKGYFNEQGNEIISFCETNGIKLISGLKIGESKKYYIDNIHLNEGGQKLWAAVLGNEITNTLPCFN